MSEQNSNGIAYELSLLHTLSGSAYSKQVERIANLGEFYPLDNRGTILICGEQKTPDYKSLLNAAEKLVSRGFIVYLLPNPHGIRTPDFILKSGNVYKTYDLKTISGKSSVRNRLIESIGQTNRVILNMKCTYDSILLSTDILSYFHKYSSALEVIVLKGNKLIHVERKKIADKKFIKNFRKSYEK